MSGPFSPDELFGGGHASPFFSPGFLRAVKETWGPLHREGGVFAVVRRRLGFLHVQALPYGHPGISPDARTVDLDLWEEDLNRPIGRIEVVDRFCRAHSRTFRKITLHETVIPLHGTWEEVERRMRKSLREQVRQSRRKGVEIAPLTDEDLPVFFRLVEATYRHRHGVAPPPRSFLSALWNHGRDSLVALKAVRGESMLSGLWILVSPDEWIAYLQGTVPEAYSLRVSPRIFYEAIRMAHERGVRLFSMGVTPPGKKRLVFFKESLGGRPYTFPLWVKEHPVFGGLRRAYRSLKKFAGSGEIEVEG